jgi:hypothetical protein
MNGICFAAFLWVLSPEELFLTNLLQSFGSNKTYFVSTHKLDFWPLIAYNLLALWLQEQVWF